jgi:dCMP deaminase
MNSNISRFERYMKTRLFELATHSKCVAYSVSAIAVNDNDEEVSHGLNGTPSGYINCCEQFPDGKTPEHHEWSSHHELHAEVNLVIKAMKNGKSIEGCRVFVSHKPCKDCTKLLIGCGVKSISYIHPYNKNNDEILDAFLQEVNIPIKQI